MSDAVTRITNTFWESFISSYILLVVLLGVIVLLFIMKSKLIDKAKNKFYAKVGVAIVIVCCCVLLFLLSYEVIKLTKDLHTVQSEDYEYVEATVVGYRTERYISATGRRVQSGLLLEVKETGEVIEVIKTEGVAIGKTYTFIVLQNSRLCEVVKEL